MSEIQDYPSRLNDPESKKFETFSYLPKMGAERIRAPVVYIVEQGLNPAIEPIEAGPAGDDYWYMWKLPMFGEKDVDTIINEAAKCHKANPDNHLRLIGCDNLKQTLGASMVIYRAKGYSAKTGRV